MDKSLGTLLLFGGLFPIYKSPTPPLTPQTKLVACIQNVFWVSTLCWVGGGRTTRKFQKGCTVYEGTHILKKNINTGLLSQGLFSMIVGYVWFLKPLSHSSSLFRAKGADTLLLSLSLRLSTILEPLDKASIQVRILKPDSIRKS